MEDSKRLIISLEELHYTGEPLGNVFYFEVRVSHQEASFQSRILVDQTITLRNPSLVFDFPVLDFQEELILPVGVLVFELEGDSASLKKTDIGFAANYIRAEFLPTATYPYSFDVHNTITIKGDHLSKKGGEKGKTAQITLTWRVQVEWHNLVFNPGEYVIFSFLMGRLSFSGDQLIGAELRQGILPGIDLSETNLYQADLSGGDFYRANFELSILQEANLNGAYLEKANLGESNLSGASLNDCKCDESIFTYSQIEATARNGQFNRADFSESIIFNSNFSGSSFREAKFIKARLTNVLFNGADLTDANFSEAVLENIDFNGAILTGATFPASFKVQS